MLTNKMVKILSATIVILALTLAAGYLLLKSVDRTKQAVIVSGVSRGQERYFQKELASAIRVSAAIKRGKLLLEQGKYDEALDLFNEALANAKLQGERSMARLYVADVYEKRRDYENARDQMVLVRDASPEWSKKPNIERARYLEYAAQGEYDLAVKHAQTALDEYMAIHSDMPVQKQEYTDRLNDLIAAKDYIESLKK